jgi:4-amino-4-deoxy-L-arabinose transferase-like glycosyltransferase
VWDWLRGHGRREALLAAALLWGAALFLVSAGAVMTDMALVAGPGAGHARLLARPARDRMRAVARREGWLLFVGLGHRAAGQGAARARAGGHAAGSLDAGHAAAGARPGGAVPWLRGLALMLAIAAPWYLLAEARTPGFLDYSLVGEHWKRFTVPGWAGDRLRQRPRRAARHGVGVPGGPACRGACCCPCWPGAGAGQAVARARH